MNMKRLIVAPIVVAAMLSAFVNTAAAATTTWDYDFGVLLTGSGAGASTAGDPSSATFAHMSVATDDYTTFIFDLKLSNLATVFGNSGAFVGSLEINTFNVDPLSSTIASGSWGVSTVKLSTSSSSSGSVSWDFTDSFCAQGAGAGCPSNNAASRLQDNEEVKWTTVFASAQNPPFDNPPFMLHVQGYGDSSKWTPTTPVPEPEIYAMLAAGLGMMGFIARRRKQHGDAVV